MKVAIIVAVAALLSKVNLIKRIESTDPGYVRRLYLMLRISIERI